MCLASLDPRIVSKSTYQSSFLFCLKDYYVIISEEKDLSNRVKE